MTTRRTPEQTVSDKINAIRARARGGTPPQVCPTCFKPAASPYRTHDERGWIQYGCVDAFHTGHLPVTTESYRWHMRPEAHQIRKADLARISG